MKRIACFGWLGLIWATVAPADWLVTRDGGRVETQGEWRVDGRRILFTLPNGTLSAMRVSEVDLEASRDATEEAKRPPVAEEAAEKPKPEPVLVLTNKDIPQAAGDSTIGDSEGEVPSTSGADLRVVDWSVEEGNGGVRLVGRLENGTDRAHSGISIRVEVRNDEGETLATSSATVTRETLIAGGITTFEARFAGYSELPGQPTFAVDSRESRRSRAEAEADEAGDEAASDSPEQAS